MNDLPATATCPECGTQLGPAMLNCPTCKRLRHSDELKQLAQSAEQSEAAGDLSLALGAWRRALELLPPGTKQGEVISAKIGVLSLRVERDPSAAPKQIVDGATKPRKGGLAWLLATAALLLSKAKTLLLGLTKGSTFFSMLLSMGVYWAAFGWRFAAGLIVSIYIHEMGHVAALARYGIRASAPMFIPGLGAVVRMKQYPHSPREDARVGLAGPLWGMAAAIGFWSISLATGWQSWAAIAKVGAWVNLFNLMPVWQLDGARGLRALTRIERIVLIFALAVAWVLTHEGLLILLLLVAAWRALAEKGAEKPDVGILATFIVLLAILCPLTQLKVRGLAQ